MLVCLCHPLSARELDELVDRFYRSEEQQLVITTNLTPKDIRVRYGRRVTDRLRERGKLIAATGPSMRGERCK